MMHIALSTACINHSMADLGNYNELCKLSNGEFKSLFV